MAHATFTREGKTESFRLLSGHKIPAVGLGTWRSGSQATHAVTTALVEVIFIKTESTFYFTGFRKFMCEIIINFLKIKTMKKDPPTKTIQE